MDAVSGGIDSEIYERYQETVGEQWPLRFESYFEPPTPRAMYLSNPLGADDDRRADRRGTREVANARDAQRRRFLTVAASADEALVLLSS